MRHFLFIGSSKISNERLCEGFAPEAISTLTDISKDCLVAIATTCSIFRTALIVLFASLFISTPLHAQLEKVIVETYYISDSADATDTIGGHLDVGSTTYRIYVDMKPGFKLEKVYGDVNHTLKISSTAPFFNNKDRGVSFGKDVSSNHLNENTEALDTWLTLGQVAKGASTYFGVLKIQDQDTMSFIGIHHDGGSAGIAGGLLTNNNPAAGIPIDSADGMVTTSNLLSSWVDYGIKNLISGKDSTIFGSIIVDSQFISNNVRIQCSGVMGVDTVTNQVLIAQLTTKGNLSFELNLTISDTAGSNIINYVANDSILLQGEIFSRYLKYPFHLICGCPDPNFVEYYPGRDCDNADSCKKLVILGCMDPYACNYDPNANISVPDLCCYPGFCQDRDPAVVCQTILLGINNSTVNFEFNLFPNPAQDQLNIQVTSKNNKDAVYELYDYSGRLLLKKNMSLVHDTVTDQLDISNLVNGLYLIRLYIGNNSTTKKFIKE